MIGFRDFAPRQFSPPKHGSLGTFESFEQVVASANAWIGAEQVEVVNVETVVLPYYSHAEPPEAGTQAPCAYVNLGNYWFASLQFVRVWYRFPKQ